MDSSFCIVLLSKATLPISALVLDRECEQYARHMTKADPRDGTILNFNSPEEEEAVEVVFNNAITPLAEVRSQTLGDAESVTTAFVEIRKCHTYSPWHFNAWC